MEKLESQITNPEPFDVSWYKRFLTIGSFQAYEYLDGDKAYRDEQKRGFVSGEIENPNLDYPKIDQEKLTRFEAELINLKIDIQEQEVNEIVKQLYRWKINEKIAELRMLQAAASDDTKRFKRYSEFIYGKPSLEVFSYSIQYFIDDLAKEFTSENPDIKRVAEELAKLLPTGLARPLVAELPTEADVGLVQTQTLKELSSVLNIQLEEGKQYTAEEIRQVFQGALDSLRAEGWQAIIDTTSKVAISVDQEEKAIKIPTSRKLAFDKLRALIAHEIGTHVARRLNGERSRLCLLGLGLDRYEKGEEGVATAREQSLAGHFDDFAGLEGHLAISLAYGLDGQPRDFRGVYEIMKRYFTLKQLVSGKDLKEALSLAQADAWNRTVRTFRGTNCATPGTCFTKDIIYREGNIDIWNVVRQNPNELVRFNVGKYDPANPRHILILNQLGISDSDLEEKRKIKEIK